MRALFHFASRAYLIISLVYRSNVRHSAKPKHRHASFPSRLECPTKSSLKIKTKHIYSTVAQQIPPPAPSPTQPIINNSNSASRTITRGQPAYPVQILTLKTSKGKEDFSADRVVRAFFKVWREAHWRELGMRRGVRRYLV